MPGLLDLYLARKGIEAQQTDRRIEPGRPDNLWDPVATDLGAHGEFDRIAKERSLQWTVRSRPRLLSVVGAAAAGWLLRRRVRSRS